MASTQVPAAPLLRLLCSSIWLHRVVGRWGDAYTNDPKKGIQVHYGPKDANDKDKTVSITNTSDEELDAALKASGDDPFVKDVVDAIKHMREADEESGNDIFNDLTKDKKTTNIYKDHYSSEEDQRYEPRKGKKKTRRNVYWNPKQSLVSRGEDPLSKKGGRTFIDPETDKPISVDEYSKKYSSKTNQSASVGLYHELIHSWRNLRNPIGMRLRVNIPSFKWRNLEEKGYFD